MLEITFISDYVCPYCYVGKELLLRAVRQTGINARIIYQPLEATEEPEPRVDTYHDPVRRERYKILDEPCKRLELNMKLPPNVIPRPYTRLAYEGWYFAKEHGKGEEYNDLMYRAYFTEERDIGDIEVLTELVKGLGLEAEAFRSALEKGVYREREKAAVNYAKRELQVKTLPTLIIHGHARSFRQYTVEEAVGILKDEVLPEDLAVGCGVDGC